MALDRNCLKKNYGASSGNHIPQGCIYRGMGYDYGFGDYYGLPLDNSFFLHPEIFCARDNINWHERLKQGPKVYSIVSEALKNC